MVDHDPQARTGLVTPLYGDVELHLDDAKFPGPVVIACASGAARFEWGGFLSRLQVPHILLRDTSERWYQNGARGWGSTLEGTLELLSQRLNAKHHLVRHVTLGLSSGSYGALLIGTLLPSVGEIIAVSPITGKGDALKPDFEPKWWHRIEHGPEHPSVADLKTFYPEWRRGKKIQAYVSDGEGTELDLKMAHRIGIWRVKQVPGHSHSNLARVLCDDGTLMHDIIGGL